MIFFDIDKVLLIPADGIFHQPYKEKIAHFLGGNWKDLKGSDDRISYILIKRSIRAVDSRMAPFIQSLQEKGVCVFGLTHGLTGKFGAIASMEQWRLNELKKIGIEFKNLGSEILFPFEGKNKRIPKFHQGIIFTCKVDKGSIFKSFMEHQLKTPTHVYFVDDQMKNLTALQRVCDELKIPFTGIHYTASKNLSLPTPIDMHVEKQIAHFSQTNEWLNDGEILNFEK